MSGNAAKLEAIRRDLTSASEAPWRRLLATTAGPDGAVLRATHLGDDAPSPETCYALERVDPTRQCGTDGARLVLCEQGGIAWGVRLDDGLLPLMERAHELQAAFGFPHHARWDIVGAFVEHAHLVGEEAFGLEGGVVILRPLAVRVRDQFMLDARRPEVPGLPAADKALAQLHAPIVIPEGATPAELLPTLFATLDLNCWPRFRELWVGDAAPTDLRYRWDQFRDAWRTSGGTISFARYDIEPAKKPKDGARVKLFVTRDDGAEHTWTRPLTFLRQGGQWRLEAGIL